MKHSDRGGTEKTDETKQVSTINISGKRYGEYKGGKGEGGRGEESTVLSQERPHWQDICAEMAVASFSLRGFPDLCL